MNQFSEKIRLTQRHNRRTVLTLAAGAAAAAGLAMMAATPAANADDAVLPVQPTFDVFTDSGATGFPPFWDGSTGTAEGSYTDLLGDTLGTVNLENFDTDFYVFGPGALESGNTTNLLSEVEFSDVTAHCVVNLATGCVGGTTFDEAFTNSGWFNSYELTPFYPTGGAFTANINDALVYEPNGSVDFGVQYLDLPDATTPVDEINLLGSGGEILLSIPVTGDLLSGL
jgi:hypothetical protein